MLKLFKEGKDVYSANTTWKLIDIDDSFPKLIKENKQKYIKTGWIKENVQNLQKMKETNNIKVTATISTRNRYFTSLPLCLTAIAMQTRVPDQLIIYDDGEHKDLREEPIYQNIFSLLQKKGIDWSVNFTDGQGQVKKSSKSINRFQTPLYMEMRR